MMFLRHGYADPDEFGIDLLRALSVQGRKEVEEVNLPEIPYRSYVSPAKRTLQTFFALKSVSEKNLNLNPMVLPEMYANFLLPESRDMYQEYGDNLHRYINDDRFGNIKNLCDKVADTIKNTSGFGQRNTLVVGHGGILNFIAFSLFKENPEILDINLKPAQGFRVWGSNGEKPIVTLF